MIERRPQEKRDCIKMSCKLISRRKRSKRRESEMIIWIGL